MVDSTTASLQDEIAKVEMEIEEAKAERKTSDSEEERKMLLGIIATLEQRRTTLYQERLATVNQQRLTKVEKLCTGALETATCLHQIMSESSIKPKEADNGASLWRELNDDTYDEEGDESDWGSEGSSDDDAVDEDDWQRDQRKWMEEEMSKVSQQLDDQINAALQEQLDTALDLQMQKQQDDFYASVGDTVKQSERNPHHVTNQPPRLYTPLFSVLDNQIQSAIDQYRASSRDNNS
eukprot:CAMPEP_0198284042 /NCGR_PEP_ID=MMETSP1449-20131203/3579_1 /TAXON_ID=420275 /ORGANISM="Attheya septentrionalis, Strain CCMP2084" /LENGTH=236 /DNA_ID=CAMNT_0043980947 /DNA_START=317 /DNA_END=1027 /DNA_ORIENTATION=+